ncbi:MAG: ChbG/HpnK family deacetylase [Candidatus Moraniibacteriota bacterium]|nr:MAG: ChbG/HpnK family deacetylase [Candidatus Moranbacteria bacterium]
MSHLPKLIITADDYGMSPLFNYGIEELASLGLITGVSVMVKRSYIEPAKLKSLSTTLGLHLELEETSTAEEMQTQIKSFQAMFGQLPAYLDGHQHKHLTPENLPRIVAVAKKLGLPVRSRNSEDRARLKTAGILTPDNFISWHPDRLHVLQERLGTATKFSVSELVVHPGYFDPACDYPYNQEREAELQLLKSSQFRTFISRFTLTSYRLFT